MVNGSKQIKNIWMVSREYRELAGAGGVKDVVYQLSKSLARWTVRSVQVVLPCYGFVDPEKEGFLPLPDPLDQKEQLTLEINMDLPDQSIKEQVQFYTKKEERVTIYLVEASRFSDKADVYTYTIDEEHASTWKKAAEGHFDYFSMNVLHQKAAIELIIALGQRPDIIHCHDGHTALLPALIRESSGYSSYFRATGCLLTLHNAGLGYHQEVADIPYAFAITGLPQKIIDEHQLELKFDPLLVGGSYAIINTVSENYARELQETESDSLTGWLGHELKSRNVIIEGVTNGIDPDFFGPQKIEARGVDTFFDPEDPRDNLRGKVICRNQLLERLRKKESLGGVECFGGLDQQGESTLFTFVGRLSEQKGVDVLLEVLPVLLQNHAAAQVLVLGKGSVDLENGLVLLGTDPGYQGRVCYLKGYSSEIASEVFAAGDFLVIPSRYEPCGLTDFIAQLSGNIPVVHHVGGLVKVRDGSTGIAYLGNSPDNLYAALSRCLTLDKQEKREIQQQAVQEIKQKYTWQKVMHNYIELYKRCYSEQV